MGTKPPSQLPILIVQHAPYEHPAALRRALESQGLESQVVLIFNGQKLPKPGEISGMISLGGPMGANDEIDHPWLLQEMKLMKQCFDGGIPIAGICLGGQMLARTLGGKVTTNPHPEIGWFPVKVNDAGMRDPLMSAAGAHPKFYQWHYDTFFPPKEAEILAESSLCPRQAFRVGDRTYGFQFHPEADHQLVDEWLQIEGTDEEILLARIAHHQACVHPPTEHVEQAKDGELFSLNFVAAISQLFQKESFVPVDSAVRDRIHDCIARRTKVVLKYYSPKGEATPIVGTIERVVEIPRGQFLFFREESTLMWPIRLDHVDSIHDVHS